MSTRWSRPAAWTRSRASSNCSREIVTDVTRQPSSPAAYRANPPQPVPISRTCWPALEAGVRGDDPVLVALRVGEVLVRRREDRARVGHRLVQEQPVEVVAQVVVGRDVPAAAGPLLRRVRWASVRSELGRDPEPADSRGRAPRGCWPPAGAGPRGPGWTTAVHVRLAAPVSPREQHPDERLHRGCGSRPARMRPGRRKTERIRRAGRRSGRPMRIRSAAAEADAPGARSSRVAAHDRSARIVDGTGRSSERPRDGDGTGRRGATGGARASGSSAWSCGSRAGAAAASGRGFGRQRPPDQIQARHAGRGRRAARG